MNIIKCLITLLCCVYSIAQTDEFLEKPAFLFIRMGTLCRYDYGDITSGGQVEPTCRYSGAGFHLTMDVREGFIYLVTSSATGGIITLRHNLAPNSDTQILTDTFKSVTGLAFDWMGKNLFWSDYQNGMIGLYNIHTLSYIPLLTGIPSRMMGLAVDVSTGRIFWSDNSPSISYAQIGSQERHLFVTSGISTVAEICIDTTDRRLYWVDNTLLKIKSVDIATNTARNIRELASLILPGNGITVSESYVFWTDATGVHAIQKNDGTLVTDFQVTGDKGETFLNGLYIQPNIANGCDIGNGGCEHICAPAPSSDKICLCKFGYTLAEDGTTCVTEILATDFLIFTDSHYNAIFQVGLHGGEPHVVDLPIKLEQPIAIDYDPDTNFVYFSDVILKTVYKFDLNSPSSVQTLRQFSQKSLIDGITLDEHTNKLYLSDAGDDIIYRMNDDGTNLEYFLSPVDNPRAIVLEHQSGYVYWSDWSETNPRIERALMTDGSNRESIVTGNLQFPNGLVLDVQANKMYWCDAGADVIEMSDLTGGSRSILTHVPGHHFGMIILGDFIYMTDWEQATVRKIHKNTGIVTAEEYGSFGRPNGIDGKSSLTATTTITTTQSSTLISSSTTTTIPPKPPTLESSSTSKPQALTSSSTVSRDSANSTDYPNTSIDPSVKVSPTSSLATTIQNEPSSNPFGADFPLEPPVMYAIIGVGGLIILAVIITIAVCCCCFHRRSSQKSASGVSLDQLSPAKTKDHTPEETQIDMQIENSFGYAKLNNHNMTTAKGFDNPSVVDETRESNVYNEINFTRDSTYMKPDPPPPRKEESPYSKLSTYSTVMGSGNTESGLFNELRPVYMGSGELRPVYMGSGDDEAQSGSNDTYSRTSFT